MFFRPNFCANCGERIERAQWGVLTSRRFCPVCETQYKGQDLIPRAIVAGGLIIGVFGFGSYLKSGDAGTTSHTVRQPTKLFEQRAADAPQIPGPKIEPTPAVDPQSQQIATLVQPPSVPRTDAEETAYFCGAETKKGTPCSRRVKGNVRCYQHTGMPAMATAAKLRIK